MVDRAELIEAVRESGYDQEKVEALLASLEMGPQEVNEQALEQFAGVLDGLAAAVDEFQGVGGTDLADREKALKAARRRFAIQLSALLAGDQPVSMDTTAGGSSTSVSVFRGHLRGLATRMAALVERTIEDSSMRKELEVAGHIQSMLVPGEDELVVGKIRAFSWFEPAEQCGGDWWTLSPLGEGDALFVLGDVTGHGVPAALVTGVLKGATDLARLGMRGALRPYQLFRMLNRVLIESVNGEYLMTGVAMRWHAAKGALSLSNAGHRSVWHWRDGTLRVVKGPGDPPLGAQGVYRYEDQILKLEVGDLLLVFSDGIPEAESPSGEELGEKPVRQAMEEAAPNGPEAIRDAIRELTRAHLSTAASTDDLTLVALEVTPT